MVFALSVVKLVKQSQGENLTTFIYKICILRNFRQREYTITENIEGSLKAIQNSVIACLCEETGDIEVFVAELEKSKVEFNVYCPSTPYQHDDSILSDFIEQVEQTKTGTS